LKKDLKYSPHIYLRCGTGYDLLWWETDLGSCYYWLGNIQSYPEEKVWLSLQGPQPSTVLLRQQSAIFSPSNLHNAGIILNC